MSSIECFVPSMSGGDMEITLESFARSASFSGITVLPCSSVHSTQILRSIADAAAADYILVCTKPLAAEAGMFALDRIIAIASDSGADMLYSDFYSIVRSEDGSEIKRRHPLNDCLKGSLRDDFDFGSILVFRTSAFKRAVHSMERVYEWAALYDLRLRMKNIVHINEYLYTTVETDMRKSGQKQFDYVDPKNRAVQIEMEAACTEHLKRIGGYLVPNFRKPDLTEYPSESFPVTASVIIPVYNRKSTVQDAVRSALSQQCSFEFNVIVVDNRSDDGTTDLLEAMAAEDSRLVHVVPLREDLCIGGCWNLAVHHPLCGEYAVQLDSDDLYSGPDSLARIVEAFREQKCAMVIGTYMMTDFNLNPIPPGVIDHKEWTEENGRNNALRINGLGAPRAFWTPLLRTINFPNVSYGEDYAVGLRISREYKIGRIYDVLYLCRRWDGNSDAALDIEKVNANNLYKDRIRTWELEARIRMNK